MVMALCEAAKNAIPEHTMIVNNTIGSGSTDMGDLSCIMPVVHPYSSGAEGKAHGSDYRIVDPEAACVGSAKLQLELLHVLLSNGAERAKMVVEKYEPMFKSKEEYLAYMDIFSAFFMD